MSKLKELRKSKSLTQEKASTILGISLRSYKTYENDEKKVGTIKYNKMLESLEKYTSIDEKHGLLTIDDIKKDVKKYLKSIRLNIAFFLDHMQKVLLKKQVM